MRSALVAVLVTFGLFAAIPVATNAAAPLFEARLEQVIRREHARSYMAFSLSLSAAFPVVDEAGVAWASRFDSMWALRGV